MCWGLASHSRSTAPPFSRKMRHIFLKLGGSPCDDVNMRTVKYEKIPPHHFGDPEWGSEGGGPHAWWTASTTKFWNSAISVRGAMSGRAANFKNRGGHAAQALGQHKRQRDGFATASHRWSKSQRRDAEGPAAGTPLDADLSQLDSGALPFSATTQPEFTVSPPSRGVSTPPCVAKPCSGSLQLLFKLGLYRCVRVHTAAGVLAGWVVAGRNGGCNCLRIFKMPMTHTHTCLAPAVSYRQRLPVGAAKLAHDG